MAEERKRVDCPDCSAVDRRDFLSAVGASALAASAASLFPGGAYAAPTPDSKAETAVKRFYKTLSSEQKTEMALPWNDARRTKISANWQITKANVSSFTEAQQKIIHEILQAATSEDGYGRFMKQTKADRGGIGNYAVAVFGDPEGDKFCFELTGRHLTLRADGDTTPGAAFGGPIIYGHGAAGNSEGNLFWYQTKRANELFQALNGDQRKAALLAKAPKESAVTLRDAKESTPGVAGGDLSDDQQKLLLSVLRDIMAPYRKEDVDEVMEVLKSGGGVDKLHMSFYQSGDLGDDGVWDVWRLESPTLVCHFRGAPHVHAYINIARREG